MSELEELREEIRVLKARVSINQLMAGYALVHLALRTPGPLETINAIMADIHNTALNSQADDPVIADKALDLLASLEGWMIETVHMARRKL